MVNNRLMKKILLLFFILFLNSTRTAMAVYVNWVQEDPRIRYSVEAYRHWMEGSLSNIGDNNLDSYVEIIDGAPGSSEGGYPFIASAVIAIAFSESNIRINKIELTLEAFADNGDICSYTVKLYNGNWHTVCSGSKRYIFPKETITANFREYSNVTKLKVEVEAPGHSVVEYNEGIGIVRIYEIKAWGDKYIDIGLRVYDGTGVIKIACEPAGILTSPLRIHKNGTTYAVVLVDPLDIWASKIKLRIKSGVKALAKID